MSTREPNTPGSLGSVLWALVSFGCCALLVVIAPILDGGSLIDDVAYVPIAAVYIGIVGSPVALAGVVVTAMVCSRVAAQGVHVAVAAVAGFVVTLAYARLIHLGDLGPLTGFVAGWVAASAALGRAAVIPLVLSRRRLARSGQLRGTARW